MALRNLRYSKRILLVERPKEEIGPNGRAQEHDSIFGEGLIKRRGLKPTDAGSFLIVCEAVKGGSNSV